MLAALRGRFEAEHILSYPSLAWLGHRMIGIFNIMFPLLPFLSKSLSPHKQHDFPFSISRPIHTYALFISYPKSRVRVPTFFAFFSRDGRYLDEGWGRKCIFLAGKVNR